MFWAKTAAPAPRPPPREGGVDQRSSAGHTGTFTLADVRQQGLDLSGLTVTVAGVREATGAQ